MSNYSFIFDVETTGLFTRKRGEKVDFRKLVNFDNCRIVSISWIIIDSNEKDTIIENKNYYIKPDKFNVPQESTKIHGLTTDYLLTNGITIHTVFQELKNLALKYKDSKDKEIANLNIELDKFKKTIEESSELYESMLDKTTKSLEKILSNTETISKIQ